ncbi:related to exodeoxyribonuclease [Pseudozyma flocculosa]|uniref:DNA-(apurinic or apyrimidinic site) endonuclease n=2 Tax=Pseudozyma flocculosa TaxID=84751 RepID=A0A5C3F049_9BASI|nr:related to exodeoxyribonuclease [Pseudozyma flocculosa]
MPPKRAASTRAAAKRSAPQQPPESPPSSPTESSQAPATKKRAAAGAPSSANGSAPKRTKKPSAGGLPDSPAAPSGNDTTAPESLPRNTELPESLHFDRPRHDDSLRIAAWNIVSLKSSEPKGLLRYIDAEDADILVLTETKVNEVPMHPKLTARYKHQYWGIGKQKSYAGIAILSKLEPKNVTYGLPTLRDADSKGRMITLEFENTFLIGTYCVNAGEGLKSMDNKIAWNKAFAEHVRQCDQRKPVIWCGDLNVVHDDRDLAQASKKWNKSPGYTQIECDAHRELLAGTADDGGRLVDVWREQHPDAVGHFTFYGWRGMCRSKGIGWRLDSFIFSERIKDRAKECEIRHECYGPSDHVPIYCDVQGPL